jgi:chromatin accessibility complex protein 1
MSQNENDNSSSKEAGTATESLIPLQRIKTIMKSSPEITQINSNVLYLVGKATELFIEEFTKNSFKQQKNVKNELNYENIATLVTEDDRFQFLSGKL